MFALWSERGNRRSIRPFDVLQRSDRLPLEMLEYALTIGLQSDTHRSIRVQEGEPIPLSVQPVLAAAAPVAYTPDFGMGDHGDTE